MRFLARGHIPLLLTILCSFAFLWTSRARLVQVVLTATKDNTLYEYDPADPSTRLNSNGSGDFFSTGRSFSRSQIRRGLVQFDFASVPPGARVIPGTVQLDLHVVDVPRHDATPRPFWFAPAPGDWGEGLSAVDAGVSGAGSGMAAMANDATWFHTVYDPATHEGQPFDPGSAGFWEHLGALGGDPLDPLSLLGEPAGVVPSEVGAITFAALSLQTQVNAWLSGQPNLGWIVLGDETLSSDTESSVRGFASREHLDPEFRPKLRFEYAQGDFNDDGSYDCLDVDALVSDIAGGNNTAPFDLNNDGVVDTADLAVWLAVAGGANLASGRPYLEGDANLDGAVDVSDQNLWNSHKFTSLPAWCVGDFNADGLIDVSDWNIWNGNKFLSSDGAGTVPEPGGTLLLVLAGCAAVCSMGRRED